MKKMISLFAILVSTLSLTGCGAIQLVVDPILLLQKNNVVTVKGIPVLQPNEQEIEYISSILRPADTSGTNPDAKAVLDGVQSEFIGYTKYEYPSSHLTLNANRTASSDNTVHSYDYIDALSKVNIKCCTISTANNFTYDVSKKKQELKFGPVENTSYLEVAGRTWVCNKFKNKTEGYTIRTWEYIPEGTKDSYYIEAYIVPKNDTDSMRDTANFIMNSMDIYREEVKAEVVPDSEYSEENQDTGNESYVSYDKDGNPIVDETQQEETPEVVDNGISSDFKDLEFKINGIKMTLPCKVKDFANLGFIFDTSTAEMEVGKAYTLKGTDMNGFEVLVTAKSQDIDQLDISTWIVSDFELDISKAKNKDSEKVPKFEGISGIQFGSDYSEFKTKLGVEGVWYTEQTNGDKRLTYKNGQQQYEQFTIGPSNGLYKVKFGLSSK